MESRSYRIGDIVGRSLPNGYLYGCVNGSKVYMHRLAWLLHTGSWPAAEIDHRNGVRHDNRIENLREATRRENMQNQRAARVSNLSSRFIGVNWMKTKAKWRAEIRINGKKKHLGLFEVEADAAAAYIEAKRLHHTFGLL